MRIRSRIVRQRARSVEQMLEIDSDHIAIKNIILHGIEAPTFDLSVKNPNGGEEMTHRSPAAIMDEIAALAAESANVLQTIRGLH